MGSVHVRSLLDGKVEGLEVSAISDANKDRSLLFPEVTFFQSSQELIQSESVDAVLIATPHYDHTTLGIASLEAGKHVLIEKPISVHKADCERLIAAHKDPSLIFAAMFQQRMDPRFAKLKKLLDDGHLGEIHRVVWNTTDWFRTAAYYGSGGWRATWKGEGGGVLLNQCPHQLDLWQWLFGMPDKLRAFCSFGRYHDIEVEDDVTCHMEYDSGCKGVFITTTGETPGTNRLEITAENGLVIIDSREPGINWERNETPMTEWNRTAEGGFSKPDIWKIHLPVTGTNPQHQGILQNFSDAILKGTPLIAPASEGIRSVELANAMLYSSFKDKTVTLPLDGEAYARELQEKIDTSTFVKKEVKSKIATDFDKSMS